MGFELPLFVKYFIFKFSCIAKQNIQSFNITSKLYMNPKNPRMKMNTVSI